MRTERKVASLLVQLVYTLLCGLVIALSVLFEANYGTELGILYSDIAFGLVFLLIQIPAMPLCLFLNVSVARAQIDGGSKARWIAWSVVSPIFFFIAWLFAMVFFVGITGGV